MNIRQLPNSHEEFALTPDGPYAIVAAGHFNTDGSPIKPSYNQLEADRIFPGIYRLTFPDISFGRNESSTFIVKATVVNPSLLEAFFYDNEEVKINPEIITPAAIQISQLNEKYRYIEIWITQPIVGANTMQYTTVDLPFMIEISQYGYKRESPRRVDINTASVAELEALPRLGLVLAKRIVATREASRTPLTLDELIAIDGISQDTVNEIRPLITFGD